jgi:hypothetical protein
MRGLHVFLQLSHVLGLHAVTFDLQTPFFQVRASPVLTVSMTTVTPHELAHELRLRTACFHTDPDTLYLCVPWF